MRKCNRRQFCASCSPPASELRRFDGRAAAPSGSTTSGATSDSHTPAAADATTAPCLRRAMAPVTPIDLALPRLTWSCAATSGPVPGGSPPAGTAPFPDFISRRARRGGRDGTVLPCSRFWRRPSGSSRLEAFPRRSPHPPAKKAWLRSEKQEPTSYEQDAPFFLALRTTRTRKYCLVQYVSKRPRNTQHTTYKPSLPRSDSLLDLTVDIPSRLASGPRYVRCMSRAKAEPSPRCCCCCCEARSWWGMMGGFTIRPKLPRPRYLYAFSQTQTLGSSTIGIRG